MTNRQRSAQSHNVNTFYISWHLQVILRYAKKSCFQFVKEKKSLIIIMLIMFVFAFIIRFGSRFKENEFFRE